MPPESAQNRFLTAPLPRLYVGTALPIMIVMATAGFMNLADAVFLGVYVGPRALTAVTLMFPVHMALAALATLVGSGLASPLARALGAGDRAGAQRILAGAHGLALVLCAMLWILFRLTGGALTLAAARGDPVLAGLGHDYIAILVAAAPVSFVLGVNFDALRCEGQAPFAAMLSLLASLANLAFNYVAIVLLHLGVAGSALATVAAQTLALSIVLAWRIRSRARLRPFSSRPADLVHGWPRILALGAPPSLSFLGLSLGAAVIIFALQTWSGDRYPVVVAAYGIVTRIMTFLYLPMLAFSLTMQAITGNNLGARRFARADASLRGTLALVLSYCLLVDAAVFLTRDHIGRVFVADPATVEAVARIAPLLVLLYPVTGLTMMLGSHFQASGEAARAAILTLPRTFVFSIPLTLLLPVWWGESGIWYAAPLAELCMLLVTAAVLNMTARRTGRRFGLFHLQA